MTAIDLDQLAHLEEQRDFLLRSLRDLERERDAGDIDDTDYRTLREDYTARAAAVLQAIEDGQARLEAATASPERRRRRRRATALTVVAAMVVASVAGLLVASSSGERVKGQELSGVTAGSSAVARDLARAHQLDGQNRVLDAIKSYDAVLKKDPGNVEALTYRGWLVGRFAVEANQAQLGDRAFSSLDQAEAADPSYGPAHCFRGILLLRLRNDPKAAVPELQVCMSANPGPEVRPLVQAELQDALSRPKG